MFAKVENNAIIEWPILSIQQRFPSTSFPLPTTDADMPEGYVRIHNSTIPTTSAFQRVVEQTPVYNGEKWVQNFVVVDMTDAEIQTQQAMREMEARDRRKEAYREEADPLYFKWQRGEATQQDWLSKVAEIKERFPKI